MKTNAQHNLQLNQHNLQLNNKNNNKKKKGKRGPFPLYIPFLLFRKGWENATSHIGLATDN